ncbi:hypothetical protein Aeqsu_2167 [Aequorivita sublithincola DSM 14238]|uniref:DUF4350 domain-containing protein n=1 Tax=Aequorivita sublithincola (strain DSM 14238 / LMG 21431 / ACAM 643 / 9-3) TaxID=746697 RepID=I3YXA9_AEQSU|nr:DUF4350 domain-containing protein [Aequorivita sublithincola]AFL81627.1 hypothetical protein Aeqsu_2167 [Aequorivita sublithincola DSM 14238]
MTKLQKIFIFSFLLVLAGLVYMEANKPQPINWFPSYSKLDKIPLGTYILHDLMKESFNENFEEKDEPPFEALQNSAFNGTYFFVNDEINFDKTELDSLLNWVEKGNTLFVSANYVGKKLLDTLKLEMSTEVNVETIGTEPLLKLVNGKYATQPPFHIKKDLPVRYFSKINTTSQTVLGVSGGFIDSLKIKEPRINFIKAPIGKGQILLHLQPEVFSNFSLLSENNATHTAQVLSYINNDETVYWDNYYKSGKHIDISPLRVLLNNKYFKWAYYFVLIGALLFIIFEGRRKQRSIPIVKPLTNKTYEYTRTIAGMYLDKKENHLIAKKQIALFLEFIRTRLRVPTENMNERFYKTVAERSGNTQEDTLNLFTFIEKINNQNNTSEEELLKLYQEIKEFKKNTDGNA